MKDYFKGQYINISNKYRKSIVVAISNIILAKRDKLPPIDPNKVFYGGNRGKYSIRVWNPSQPKVKCDIIGNHYTKAY